MGFKDLVDLGEVSVDPADVRGLKPGERFGEEGTWVERKDAWSLFAALPIDEVRKRLRGGGEKK